jgi:hypothetical protein
MDMMIYRKMQRYRCRNANESCEVRMSVRDVADSAQKCWACAERIVSMRSPKLIGGADDASVRVVRTP